MPTREQLPQDKVTLQDMVLELLTTIQRSRLNEDELRHRIAIAAACWIYGPRTERFDPNQGSLFDEAADGQDQPAPAEPPPTEPASRAKRKARPHGRRKLPKDLPRREQHHTLTEAERFCICGCLRIDIGADRSEQLDWQPASYFVWEHWIHKYLCPGCTGGKRAAADTPATVATSTEATTSMDKANNTETTAAKAEVTDKATAPASADAATANETVTTAATQAAVNATSVPPTESLRIVPGPRGPAIISAVKPAMPIHKGLPGPGLLAHVIVSKYCDHLPLYRQTKISKRQGVVLPRSTTCDWMAACADLLRPLYDLMVTKVLLSWHTAAHRRYDRQESGPRP